MPDLFSTFLENPSGENFGRMREMVIAQPDYAFYSEDLDELEELNVNGEFGTILDKVSQLMPNWLLSPRAHQLIGSAAQESGDEETAKRERYMMNACLRGILESGDGSRGRPYPVTHTRDEYDVVAALGKEVKEQRVVHDEQGPRDVLVCSDDTELYFDISPSVGDSTPAPA
jgi:hypothetical protein